MEIYLKGLNSGDRDEKRKRNYYWTCTTGIAPLTIYSYLKARFGKPNGFQTFLKKKNDVDNLIHWDFTLICDGTKISFYGFLFNFDVLISGVDEKRDGDEKLFFSALAQDFRNYARPMRTAKKSFEKWNLFLNTFYYLSEMVNGLSEKLGAIDLPRPTSKKPTSKDEYEALMRSANGLHSAFETATSLKLIVPVWIESFINLVILMLADSEIRSNPRAFTRFKRSPVLDRIKSLHLHCQGFKSPIEGNEPEVKAIRPLFQNRNKILHGHVGPNTSRNSEIYFDDRTTPLIGNNTYMTRFFHDLLLSEVHPKDLLNEVNAGEGFIGLILRNLDPPIARMLVRVMSENMPGWDAKRRIIGVVLPPQFVDMVFPGADGKPISRELTLKEKPGSSESE